MGAGVGEGVGDGVGEGVGEGVGVGVTGTCAQHVEQPVRLSCTAVGRICLTANRPKSRQLDRCNQLLDNRQLLTC